jgi:hypothetical protein
MIILILRVNHEYASVPNHVLSGRLTRQQVPHLVLEATGWGAIAVEKARL